VGDLRSSGLVTAMNHVDMTPPLSGVTVVDMTTALGEYAGRLLADLGADVIRYDDAAPDVIPSPCIHERRQADSWLATRAARSSPKSLLQAQILLTSEGPAALRANDMHPHDVARRHPMLVHVAISRSASPAPTLTARPAISPSWPLADCWRSQANPTASRSAPGGNRPP
jgi:hypothetical protein